MCFIFYLTDKRSRPGFKGVGLEAVKSRKKGECQGRQNDKVVKKNSVNFKHAVMKYANAMLT